MSLPTPIWVTPIWVTPYIPTSPQPYSLLPLPVSWLCRPPALLSVTLSGTLSRASLKASLLALLLDPGYRALTEELRELVGGDGDVRAVLRDVWGTGG
ncbi:hypothetical protein TeGR_g10523 [Tetraparma gracilis]|uniref:Uncharacterized protein n=1 Tax=Tetraparma gracilis TaxID=2962635 RepID=A0ABQ6NBU7_9STRA|nr:hypothetical protein TeGR_g10523 [Tetraparma gracilis]